MVLKYECDHDSLVAFVAKLERLALYSWRHRLVVWIFVRRLCLLCPLSLSFEKLLQSMALSSSVLRQPFLAKAFDEHAFISASLTVWNNIRLLVRSIISSFKRQRKTFYFANPSFTYLTSSAVHYHALMTDHVCDLACISHIIHSFISSLLMI